MVQSMIVLFLALSAVKGHHDEECLAPFDLSGEHYNGNVGVSESGERCQRWGREWPVGFQRFCRKVDGKDKPGCFVKLDGQRTFEYCNIPACTSHAQNILIIYNENDHTHTYKEGNRKPVMLDTTGQKS